MKVLETTTKTIDGNVFYIRPLPAMTAARLSADLSKLLVPIIGSISPILVEAVKSAPEVSNASSDDVLSALGNIDMNSVTPAISNAFSTLDGAEVERLMKMMLLDYDNISVAGEATEGAALRLTSDLLNEVFCGEIQNMYILCFYVIQINFKGFFKKIFARFGVQTETTQTAQILTNTESST